MSNTTPRPDPRISINKLGEYMIARPRRRRRIITDQKHPPPFQVARYTEAQDAIVNFLENSADEEVIYAAIDALGNTTPNSDWDESRIQLCVEALDSFIDFYDPSILNNYVISAGTQNPEKLSVADVQISVRPELILSGTDRSGNAIAGAVKLYIGKTLPLDRESGLFVATTVHQFVDTFHSSGVSAPPKACFVVDVFDQQIYIAPRSFIRRREDIEAACEEIARAWATA